QDPDDRFGRDHSRPGLVHTSKDRREAATFPQGDLVPGGSRSEPDSGIHGLCSNPPTLAVACRFPSVYLDSRATWTPVTSQRRTVLSKLPEARSRPSDVKPTDVTPAVWPVSVASRWPAVTSQSSI